MDDGNGIELKEIKVKPKIELPVGATFWLLIIIIAGLLLLNFYQLETVGNLRVEKERLRTITILDTIEDFSGKIGDAIKGLNQKTLNVLDKNQGR